MTNVNPERAPDELAELGRLATIGRLTGGALHEIANPLLALTGTLELLQGHVDPEARDRLELARGTAEEIAEIVRALQAFARDRHLPEADVEVAAAVDGAVALVRRLSAVRDVEIEVAHGAGRRVRARPGAVAHVLVALLLDALAALPDGGTVEVRSAAEGVSVRPSEPSGVALEALRAAASGFGADVETGAGGARLVLV